jgi:CTP synthase
MENEYLIEAVRQLRHEFGEQNVLFVHLVYLPLLGASQELKTRPAQFSVKDLRARGIEPDILVVRADKPIEKNVLRKLSLMTGVEENCVIPSTTVKSIYQVPVNYQAHALGNILLQKLNLSQKPFDMSKWNILLHHIEQSKEVKKIAMVGKYCALEDAYYSLNEGLKVAGYRNGVKIQLSFVDAERLSCHPELVSGSVVEKIAGQARNDNTKKTSL